MTVDFSFQVPSTQIIGTPTKVRQNGAIMPGTFVTPGANYLYGVASY